MAYSDRPARPMKAAAVLHLALGVNRAGVAGAVVSARRFNRITHQQHLFLQEVEETTPAPKGDKYPHPADVQQVRRVAKPGPLTGTDLAWLDRLPRDPGQVRFDDARELATLRTRVNGYPHDARLVDAIWQPVKLLHDRNAAQAAYTQATRPLPQVPASTHAALLDAVAGESGQQLTERDAFTRATEVLQTALDRRKADHDAKVESARAAVAAAEKAISDYAATTHADPTQTGAAGR